MSIKRLSLILNILFLLILLLFLLDEFTAFDIRSQSLKSFVYYGILIAPLPLSIWNILTLQSKTRKAIGTSLPVLVFIWILVSGIPQLLFAKGVWEAQVILYQNKHNRFQTIEYQLQDIGALGYNHRRVKVTSLTPWFMIAQGVPADFQPADKWVKVDKYVGPEEY